MIIFSFICLFVYPSICFDRLVDCSTVTNLYVQIIEIRVAWLNPLAESGLWT